MAKMRTPLSLRESAAFAPEFAPKVQLCVVAVHVSLLQIWPSPEAWQQLWAEHCPGLAEASDGFALLPLHPLNAEKLRTVCSKEFEAGSMRLCAEAVEAVPTLSLRTLVPLHCFRGLRIKLPVPLVATSLPRYVSPVEVRGSVLISRALRQLTLPKELVLQLEEFAAHLRFGEGASYSYEEARYCSAIFRDSPAAVGHLPGSRLVPLGAMFCSFRDDGPSAWQELWKQHNIVDGRGWFAAYCSVVVPAQLGVFLRYGISLEAHQQNTTLEFDSASGNLRRMICQELGGGTFWDPERLALLEGVDFRHEVYERDDVLVPFSKCLACLRHTMLRMHLLPLAEEVAKRLGVPLAVLREDLAVLVRKAPADAVQDEADRLPCADFASYASATVERLLAPRGSVKALLRMRLLQTKSEIYVDRAAEGGTDDF
eukprot:TRINITY_DN24505_c0_g1_i1.p1 TRINITY_DN24505_c0_g1~~TRINITY_DN24505_c0_g1_i1.p1  ORF type:complete len:438 (+),score=94.66 TRINITY_DN24505_c0_g1_i1:36-1316(+)